ncbi:4a-hydroxytetrahydrobiopterin dehydratase [Amycolatopsis taiwanensis]|uniref:Putative pterin-4-alpha-carbinolamine dehydratase n=1 Tax=Amycolatopsis taiwanensis TaxID=342230 RepID=A0A9W6VEF5_9PSEU|nr:4a-hydroxytetrahydrobiopterin dehydratase [Amycolatopsis taiwanensis]GLY64447.1 4a-hydroxytetrahydrobiopterin dehydratase [Amycolatopsis taiwanensis]
MAELLNDEEISDALTKLPTWQREGDSITRTAELASFGQAMEAVNRVAELAESVNHHPDIDIRWRNVTFRLSTHSAGGLTAKDVSLAEQIDETIDNL